MTDRPYHVYVVQGRGQRDYADCQAALATVPARMTALPFIGNADELIARARDADGPVVTASPVTRDVMSALEGLKTIVRIGVGYDVIDVPAATVSRSSSRDSCFVSDSGSARSSRCSTPTHTWYCRSASPRRPWRA